MPRLVPVPAKKILKLLVAHGFVVLRITGSHHFLINKVTNKTTTIPVHGNEELGQGLLRKILRDIDMSVEEFELQRKK
jgi:predicted RNA binding protein YcfA (HicA-like mRNA interferase family)